MMDETNRSNRFITKIDARTPMTYFKPDKGKNDLFRKNIFITIKRKNVSLIIFINRIN